MSFIASRSLLLSGQGKSVRFLPDAILDPGQVDRQATPWTISFIRTVSTRSFFPHDYSNIDAVARNLVIRRKGESRK
jgi:hypothetical protein